MFLGWFDADKKKPVHQKVSEAIERHVEKFGTAPELCLVNPVDATELPASKHAPAIAVRVVDFLPRWTFYVGVEDEPQPLLDAA